jgi:two-component system, chemotaxis family, response regulator WspR
MPEMIGTPSVLLVTGSTQTTRAIDKLLASQFNLLHAEDSSKAWEILQEKPSISVLICALKKSIDKTALLERIRHAQNRLLVALPVLLLVGESDSEDLRDQAFSSGASDFINMPFSSIELKTRVRLHAQLYNVYRQNQDDEVLEEGGDIDLLNTLMQQESFLSRLQQEMSFSIRHKSDISVCLLKIDGADELSDKYGKDVLTAIIRAQANKIDKQIRKEDSYAYLSDATFAILLPVTNGMGANIAIHRLIEELDGMHLKHDGKSVATTHSAGLYSFLPQETMTTDDIMQTLEKRLATAEQKGPGQVVSSKSEVEDAKISVEQALNKIHYGHTDDLQKYLPDLLETLKPLLKFAHQHDDIDFQDIIDSLDD